MKGRNGPSSLVWLRLDLRVADNPALHAAVQRGRAIVPVFIWCPEEEGEWPPGAASRWWLHQSLVALDTQLRQLGSRLIIRRGPTLAGLLALVAEIGADAVFWNHRYEPAVMARDAGVKEALGKAGLAVESFNAALLHEPWTIQNQSGKPFQVFTPFWKNCLAQPNPPQPLPAPKRLTPPPQWPKSLALADLALEPEINWADGIRATWQPGEVGARKNLHHFVSQRFDNYTEQRNRPDTTGTSRLSPHLHFGEVSPRQIWHMVQLHEERTESNVSVAPVRQSPGDTRTGHSRSSLGTSARQHMERPASRDWRSSQFLAELGWREFAHHLLFHFPHTPTEPLRAAFKEFPWRDHPGWLCAWQKGRTGYPIVDAGMRELWETGWMHNRVRMIVASFLVKDLLLPWQEGARWFWDTLVDADLAQNTLGWQWTAGCGADAAPYFRIFNPVSQGQKFDPAGDYVRRWCPELARLPVEWIHQPYKAPPQILRAAGVGLNGDYPEPIVNHAIAREVSLEAYGQIKPGSRSI